MTDHRETIERLVDAANYQARHDPPMDKMLVDAALALDRLLTERDAAQTEIERLRAGGCARDQRTTQYCAEAMSLMEERDAAYRAGAEAMRQACMAEINRQSSANGSRFLVNLPIPLQEPKP